MTDTDQNREVQGILDKYIADIENKAKEAGLTPNVILLHHIISPNSSSNGASNAPGDFFRRSSLKICSDTENHISNWFESGISEITHQNVHSNFFSYLDRENTFLDYMLDHILEAKEVKEQVGELRKWTFHFGISGENSEDSKTKYFKTELVNNICLNSAAKVFIHELYTGRNSNGLAIDWNNYFLKQRMQGIRNFAKTRGEELPSVALQTKSNEDILSARETICNEILYWRRLHSEVAGLQSAISYMGTLCSLTDDTEDFSVSVFSYSHEHENALSITIAMLAFSGKVSTEAEHDATIKTSLKNSESELREYSKNNTEMNFRKISEFKFNPDLDKHQDELEKFKAIVKKEIYNDDAFSNNAFNYSVWCLMLLQKIQGRMHEDRRLNFYFLCGERSIFADKTIFYTLKGTENLRMLSLDTTEAKAEFEERLQDAAEIIQKEHFPWFEGGRYALFWDRSSPNDCPLSLVKLKHGNWEQIARAKHYGTSEISVPECIFFYSLGLEEDTGAIHLKPIVRTPTTHGTPTYRNQKTLLNPLVDWRHDRWVLGSSEIKTNLERFLCNQFGLGTLDAEHWAAMLPQMAFRISLEKHKGGLIVVMKPGIIRDNSPFKSMGNPIELPTTSNPIDQDTDRINLIAHDGSSVAFLGDKYHIKHWTHRGYLSESNNDHNALCFLFDELQNTKLMKRGKIEVINNKFEKINNSLTSRHPLSLKGTRRWAAAIAAFHNDVILSLVISQDGDIQVWHVDCEDPQNLNKDNFKVFEILKNGEMAEYYVDKD